MISPETADAGVVFVARATDASSTPYFVAVLTAVCTLIVSVVVAWFTSRRTAQFQMDLLDQQEHRKALNERLVAQRHAVVDFERQRQITYTVKLNTEQMNERLADFLSFRARVRFAFGSDELADQVAGVLCLHLVYRNENIAVGARPPPEQIREREAWDRMYAHKERVERVMLGSIRAIESALKLTPSPATSTKSKQGTGLEAVPAPTLEYNSELAAVLDRHRLANRATRKDE